MLRDSTVAVVVVVVVVVVVRTRPRTIPLAMIHMRKSIHGFPFVPLYGYGAPLGGLRPPSSAIMNIVTVPSLAFMTFCLSIHRTFVQGLSFIQQVYRKCFDFSMQISRLF